MDAKPLRAEAQLVVAAVRVLEHREKHPPTEDEIAALLRWHEDRARVLVHQLCGLGVLDAIESPFSVHYQLGDESPVDDLPEDENVGGTIAREIEDFERRSEAEAQRLERLLGGPAPPATGEDESLLENDFEAFKRRRPPNPFGDD